MAKNKTLELSIKIAGKMDKSLTAALKDSQGQISSFSRSISNIGTAGLAAMGALAAGTVATIASCTKEAAKFENYMADVVKYVDGLADATGKVSDKISKETGKTYAQNYAAMKDAILDLSTQIPYTQEELAALAGAAGEAGKSMSEIFQVDSAGNVTGFLKNIAMAGTAMDISADQAGEWAAKWETAFQMEHEEIMVLFDQINYLAANGAASAADIAEIVNTSGSLGGIAGMDPAAIAAIGNAMLSMGSEASVAATSINRMLVNMSKGEASTKAQKKAWESLGMTASGVAHSLQQDATGTVIEVLEAINRLDADKQAGTLNTLFGQWAIKDAAKLAGNIEAYTKSLEMVADPALYTGSMEREFLIKATTPEAIDTMLKSTRQALQIEVGDAFLPAEKELKVSLIGFMNTIRENMPELTQLAESLGKLASKGVTKLGEAMDASLPYIQKGLDYLANNGDQVARVIGIMAAAFVGMKFAPAAEGLLSGAGGLLFGRGSGGTGGGKSGGLLGGIKSLFTGGKKAGAAGAGFASAFGGAASSNGFGSALGATISSLLSGNGIAGTTGLLSTAAGSPGMLSSYVGAGSVVRNAAANSSVGQWLGGIGTAMGNTKTGGFLSGLMGKAGGLLGAAKSGAGGLLGKAGSAIAGSKAGVAVGGMMGKAGGLFSAIAGSGAAKAIGGAASGGMGVLSSVWGPIAGGFGSLLSGALPIVGVISSIIAVVSILGDNLEGIRTIVGNVFGEQGLALFDSFTNALARVGDFINGLFADGGVAAALAPMQEAITSMFGADAGAAFSGITTVLQSVMGVIGQIVTFSTTTVKPIIQDLFNFITQTVVPIILQTISAAAPYISSIISGIGSAVMTVAQIIAQAIQFAMPIIQVLATTLLNIGQVVIPAVLAAISVFAEGISNAIAGVKTVFEGIITFITGVFSGNWKQAWEGVRSIFTGIFDTLGALFKAPINAVIALINKAISGINGLGLDIPDWVPLIGGKKFSINIPEIPMLAKGGFTNGASIAGEAGTEAVISFQRAVRQDNIRTWAMAGRMLGVQPAELKEIPEGGGGTGGGITFSPQIIIQGNADRSVIDEALAEAQARFEAWYLQMQRKQARTAY